MRRQGQCIFEYSVLILAVAMGVAAAAKVAYNAFVAQAQAIEEHDIVF